jgi:hypothetical protein
MIFSAPAGAGRWAWRKHREDFSYSSSEENWATASG